MNRHFRNIRAFVGGLSVLFFVLTVPPVGAESPSSVQDDTVPVAAYRVQAGRLAETFSSFVLGDKSADTSVRSRKISFFYGDPSLVGLRTEIRKKLSRL